MHKRSDFSTSLPTLVMFLFFPLNFGESFLWGVVFVCFFVAILMRVRWYLVVFICISLQISDAEHLFRCLLVICIYLLREISSQVFPTF